MHLRKQTLFTASVMAIVAGASAAQAQTAAPGETTEQVVVIGSRFGGRTAVESPTPVDNVSAADLQKSGGVELQQMMKVSIPSFSTPSPATAGALDFLQQPTLRGLGPGELLVLFNGKRYHPDATLNTGKQIGRGDIEYNFNTIPVAALSGVEVLRDGAAAQYGSDAIAGVINLRLNDQLGTNIQLHGGISTQGDGEQGEISAAHGFDLGNGGFIRVTADYKVGGSTNRALPDTRQQYFGIGPGGTLVTPSGNYGSGIGLTPPKGTLDPREATFNRNIWHFGSSPYHSEAVVVNSAYPISPDVTLYVFGNLSHMIGNSTQFFRGPANDATVRALHPDGFLPVQRVRFTNLSVTGGLRGDDLLGFKWDISTTYGGSRNQYGLFNTNNATLGAASPVDFKNTERAQFLQSTTNLDLTREINLGNLGPVNLALGAEYRNEHYGHKAGQPDAYADGGVPILDGPNAGKVAPGTAQPDAISPLDAASLGRNSTAVYAELEKTFADILDLDVAVRHENYTDFGEVTNFKAAGRLDLTGGFALRASYGTGFRAPALAQEGFTSTISTFVNSQQAFTKFVAAGSALGNVVGAPALKPEAANNVSFGLVYGSTNLTASVDLYQIKLKHRIVYSSTFASTALTNYLAGKGFGNIKSVAFETNAADTTTQGIDITGTYRYQTDNWGQLTATVAANFSDTEFDKIAGTPAQLLAQGITTPILDMTEQYRIAHATPRNKETLDLDWLFGDWEVDLTNTRYGSVAQVDFSSSSPAQIASFGSGYDLRLLPIAGSANSQVVQYFQPDIITDLSVGYQFNDALKFTLGASNLFDIYPDRQIASTVKTVAAGTNGGDNAGIFPYSYLAPYGTVGRFVYLRAGYSL